MATKLVGGGFTQMKMGHISAARNKKFKPTTPQQVVGVKCYVPAALKVEPLMEPVFSVGHLTLTNQLVLESEFSANQEAIF